MTVTWLPSTVGPPRVGFVIGRALGNAVVRNRLRRRLRAAFATLAPSVPPGTYLFRPAPAVATMPFEVLTDHVQWAIGDATTEHQP